LSLITLTTDFGYRDPFVGQMKGVLLGINPGARIIDITHGIGPHDVMEAALAIGDSRRYFPDGTVHMAVVDPGVGSERRALIISAEGQLFVGPDNGVFTEIINSCPQFKAFHITEESFFLQGPEGGTFHGRDLFAPVAAWLSKGKGPAEFGPRASGLITLDMAAPRVEGLTTHGEIIRIDVFGNCITNIKAGDIQALPGRPVVRVRGMELDVLAYYAGAKDNRPHALVNSDGRVEIFVYKGSARKALGVSAGEKVELAGK
jgi:S-adenosylmethionine hydrolase